MRASVEFRISNANMGTLSTVGDGRCEMLDPIKKDVGEFLDRVEKNDERLLNRLSRKVGELETQQG